MFRRRDRLQRFEIDRDRLAVGIGQLAGALDDLAHRRADEIEIRGLAGLQEIGDLGDAPFADAGLRVRRDVGDLEIVGTLGIAGIGGALLQPAEKIARRVAFAAMRHRIGEVVAAVPRRILAGDRLQRSLGEEQRAPADQQEIGRAHV